MLYQLPPSHPDAALLASLTAALTRHWDAALLEAASRPRWKARLWGGASAWAAAATLATRLPSPPPPRAAAAPSTLAGAGLGVFATAPLLPGQLACLYACAALSVLPPAAPPAERTWWGLEPAAPPRVPLPSADEPWLPLAVARGGAYEVRLREGRTLLADPARREPPAYVAQLLNDGARPRRGGGGAREYAAASRRRRNARLVAVGARGEALHLAAVATRRVRRGEELFVSYGWEYWKQWGEREEGGGGTEE
ncbi:hypothetical protein AB1Y20_017034 [Prymnesium parvum]|uniref:SET domain-containing protein n=1 Tax=Prymnesium parvum TaxID=97485 RepID=A0AB34IC62_PRYPA